MSEYQKTPVFQGIDERGLYFQHKIFLLYFELLTPTLGPKRKTFQNNSTLFWEL